MPALFLFVFRSCPRFNGDNAGKCSRERETNKLIYTAIVQRTHTGVGRRYDDARSRTQIDVSRYTESSTG